MRIPETISKMKLRKLRCCDCISFDRKTKKYCFLLKTKRRPDQPACNRIRVEEEKSCKKSGSETTPTDRSG